MIMYMFIFFVSVYFQDNCLELYKLKILLLSDL